MYLGNMADAGTGSDPRYLRALAHPLRWRIIDLLRTEGTATVTRCSQVLGESTASCSYHLAMLAKYGYIRAVPGEGREKPWRIADRYGPMSLLPQGSSAEEAMASDAAIAAHLDYEAGQLKDFFLRRREVEPEDWRNTWTMASQISWMTPAQVKDIGSRIGQILNDAAAADDPATRPPDARPMRLFLANIPAELPPPA
jgi:Helix-turn-helix domain